MIRLANALEDAGVQRGDRILWLAQNDHGVLEGIVASGKLGAMFCPANWRQTADEMAFVIDDLEPKVVIWQDAEIGAAVRSARETARHRDALWLALDSSTGTDAATKTSSPAALRESGSARTTPDLPALIIYTAAFGGRPNGAMLSQTAIAWQDLALIDIQDLTRRHRVPQLGAAVPRRHADGHDGDVPHRRHQRLHPRAPTPRRSRRRSTGTAATTRS